MPSMPLHARCGLGLPGFVCARYLQAESVLLTDRKVREAAFRYEECHVDAKVVMYMHAVYMRVAVIGCNP